MGGWVGGWARAAAVGSGSGQRACEPGTAAVRARARLGRAALGLLALPPRACRLRMAPSTRSTRPGAESLRKATGVETGVEGEQQVWAAEAAAAAAADLERQQLRCVHQQGEGQHRQEDGQPDRPGVGPDLQAVGAEGLHLPGRILGLQIEALLAAHTAAASRSRAARRPGRRACAHARPAARWWRTRSQPSLREARLAGTMMARDEECSGVLLNCGRSGGEGRQGVAPGLGLGLGGPHARPPLPSAALRPQRPPHPTRLPVLTSAPGSHRPHRHAPGCPAARARCCW